MYRKGLPRRLPVYVLPVPLLSGKTGPDIDPGNTAATVPVSKEREPPAKAGKSPAWLKTGSDKVAFGDEPAGGTAAPLPFIPHPANRCPARHVFSAFASIRRQRPYSGLKPGSACPV